MSDSQINPWKIIESYFRDNHLRRLVRHQLESYNDFVMKKIPDTIRMFNPIQVRTCQPDSDDKDADSTCIDAYVDILNFRLLRPKINENTGAIQLMFPSKARQRNFTYASTMIVDVRIKYVYYKKSSPQVTTTHHSELTGIHLGKLPIMVRSAVCLLEVQGGKSSQELGECRLDPGGYFIISGSEKTALVQERAAENMVQCFNTGKSTTRWDWMAEIKSVPDKKAISPKQLSLAMAAKDNGWGPSISVIIPRLKSPIPIQILFRAYGIVTDQEFCQLIVAACGADLPIEKENIVLEKLKGSVIEANSVLTVSDALCYLGDNALYTLYSNDDQDIEERKLEFGKEILKTDVFPHCTKFEDRVYFLAYMTSRLVRVSLGWDKPTDRDCYINKRLDMSGVLLNNLFRNYYNKMVKDLQKQLGREIQNGSWQSTEDYDSIVTQTNIYKIVKASTLENGLKRALATGDFGIKHNQNTNKVGVAQVLNRLTYIASLSHLRRVNTPIDKSGKLIPPRYLHPSSWGFLCPAETPEGHSVGVVKNLSYMTHLTIASDTSTVYDIVSGHIIPLSEMNREQLKCFVKVFINGAWLGNVDDAWNLYTLLKRKKMSGEINIYASIVFDYSSLELRVCTEGGRPCRPLLRVKNNKLVIDSIDPMKLNDSNNRLDWDKLTSSIASGTASIEYVDPSEQNAAMIAMFPNKLVVGNKHKIYNYTHCEIHPSTMFGILASCIPFLEHNQSPRNTYQCAMGKQAMGVYVTNYVDRLDKTAFVLTYPMKPLVDTRVMDILGLHKVPSGEQVIVAIMTHTGYNQEDSILFNEASIKRGLFQATIFTTVRDEDKKVSGDEEIRGRPNKLQTKGLKFANYDKVGVNGVIPNDVRVDNRDILIAKSLPIREARNDLTQSIRYQDQSIMYRTQELSYVDKTFIQRNGEGYNFCKVRVRNLREPAIGDKFSSRHGQKGTIGNIIPEEDMPFTGDGMRPDIIINPHAIPSRMTIAQLKETLVGKLILNIGCFGDGTSFGEVDINKVRTGLSQYGFESSGEEVFYDGCTGEIMKANVFCGPAFYQRLKHMVKDKIHSRSHGPKINLTRQPAEGRRRDGGHRFGEMERDCMCSHGAAAFTKGRLMDASDKFSTYVCKRCGTFAAFNNKKHIHICRRCDNRIDFAHVQIPYACKLLFQELETMNVAPRIITE